MKQNSNDYSHWAYGLVDLGFEVLLESFFWIIGAFADIG